MKIIGLVVSYLILLSTAVGVGLAIPAFPGAEGFGADTRGGRGGRAIEVTNLNDSGPGSLRAACEAEGPRIVVFRVGGTIRLRSHLQITKPYIMIAGQTAPGGGILLRDAGLVIRTHDVVVRYLRVRVGESRVESAGSQDCLHLGKGKRTFGIHRIVVDHCSFSWGIDENTSAYGRVRDFTIQWCIISEGLRNSLHHKGPHSMGLLLGRDSRNCSIHHNLFAHNNARNPRLGAGRRDIVNNVIHNWGSHAAGFSEKPEVNFVGNYYKPGPNTGTGRPMISGQDIGTLYLRDNVYPGDHESQWDLVQSGAGATAAETSFYAPAVTTYAAEQAYGKVLDEAGCWYPMRDTVDERIIRDIRQGTGRIIDNPKQVGSFPDIAKGTPPPDGDHDGMPDAWEIEHGLNPRDGSDGDGDRDGDGYTNIEEYINSLVGG